MKNTRMRVQAIVKNQEKSVEVLYQKMGDRWFAFSYVNNEVYVGSIDQGEVNYTQAEEVKFEETIGRS
jgi:hypothetical protein